MERGADMKEMEGTEEVQDMVSNEFQSDVSWCRVKMTSIFVEKSDFSTCLTIEPDAGRSQYANTPPSLTRPSERRKPYCAVVQTP